MIATGAQIRAARALLGWRREDLARAAGLHTNAVAYWEGHEQIPHGEYREPVGVRRMREVLERASVECFSTPSPGVRLCP